MKTLILNFLLATIAVSLLCIFSPVIVIFTAIHLTFKYNKKRVMEYYSVFFRSIAISIDQLGNVFGQHLFNFIMLTNTSQNPFGNPDETLSTVLYKNKIHQTLSIFGKILLNLLETVDPGHGEESFRND